MPLFINSEEFLAKVTKTSTLKTKKFYENKSKLTIEIQYCKVTQFYLPEEVKNTPKN